MYRPVLRSSRRDLEIEEPLEELAEIGRHRAQRAQLHASVIVLTGSGVDLHDEASRLMKGARWKDAKALLLAHRAECERSWKLAWELGWACFKLGELEDAKRWLERSVQLEPSGPVPHFGLGAVLEELDDDAAEAPLKRSLEMGDATVARVLLASFYMRRNRLDEAEAVHLEGLRARPGSRSRTLAYADFLNDLRRDSEADVLYEKARSLAGHIPKRVVADLESIDWSVLETAYGFANQPQGRGGTIPEEIENIWAREDVALAALRRLWLALVYDDDYLAPAAVHVVPFLGEALRSADTSEHRLEIIGVLIGLAQNAGSWAVMRGEWVSELRARLSVLRGVIAEGEWEEGLRLSVEQFLEDTNWGRVR